MILLARTCRYAPGCTDDHDMASAHQFVTSSAQMLCVLSNSKT